MPINPTDLAFTPALTLAQLIRKREISPLELTQLYLDRIQQFDSQLGSFFTVAAETAQAEARAKTEQLANIKTGDRLPLFFGVPTAIKDLNPVAGLPCTFGVAALKEEIATHDDAVTQRMKEAGFILLGKTAVSELGSFPYTEPPGFPPTRNPWNLDYTAGGSSGGAAAAVAAGLCPIAQGSDGGGSIRVPAACCGLVGIKPSRGRVSHGPVGDYQSGIATNGPLGRTVADGAALLDVMSGYVTGDPYWLPDPEIPFLEAAGQSLSPLRIAFAFTVPPFPAAAASCQRGVQETAQRLEAMGHILEAACPNCQDLIEPFKRIWAAGVGASAIPLELLSPFSQWLAPQAGSAGDYLQAVHQMQVVSRQIVAFFDNFDVLLLPVYRHPPIRVGEWDQLSPAETLDKIVNWIAPCPLANASGLPAIALPTGFDENGLPIGVQLVGRPAAEGTLIALAAQLENANPLPQRPSFLDVKF